jgi:hypothetical protein
VCAAWRHGMRTDEWGESRPLACEGGHTDFAPRNELEIELLRYLLSRFGHVSYERVLSGPGLSVPYQFFRDTGRGVEPQWLIDELAQRDPAAVIAQAALAEKNKLCVQALNLFVSLYGAEGKSGVKDDGNGWSVHWGRDRAEDSAKVAGALPAGGLLRERSYAPSP